MDLHEMADAVRAIPPRMAADRRRIAQAMVAPETCYAAPCDVLLDLALDWEEKVQLLRNWKADLELRSIARDEGMTGRPDEDLARAIASASSVLARLEYADTRSRGLAWSVNPAHGWAVSGH